MSLHPIKALNQIIDEYKDFLLTEFRAKDPKLKESLEREIEKPGFLAQEPFFQAHRSFVAGKTWQDLSIDEKLAKVMERTSGRPTFLHQSDSIEDLLCDVQPNCGCYWHWLGKTECIWLLLLRMPWETPLHFKAVG